MPGRGGLLSLVGKGIAMGAEYREHRKEQKQARANAQDEHTEPIEQSDWSPATQFQHGQAEPPPGHADAALPSTASRTLKTGGPPALPDDKRGEISSEEDFDSDYESLEDDEELLELDEALTSTDTKGLPTYDESEQEYQPVDELVRDVINTSRPPPTSTCSGTPFTSQSQLPCPVILPQRRPRKKARGFIRAYSPVLSDCGISQEVFLKFLKNFHTSSQASPIFPIIRFSAAIAGLAPSVIAIAICAAAQVAASVGAEVQSRARTNDFLDRMNEELFKPAGLYCMIVKYKSDADMQQKSSSLINLIRAERVDVTTTNQTIAKYTRTTASGDGDPTRNSMSMSMSNRIQNLRLASASTRGTAMLPDSAPLIFPDIDHTVAQAGPETFKDKTHDAKKFLAHYLDRRAQMDQASQDPNSSLTRSNQQQQHSFKTSIADPNHPMHSGGLIALVSGGKLTPRMDKRADKMERDFSHDTRRVIRGRESSGSSSSSRRRRRRRRGYRSAYHEELYARLGLHGDRVAERREQAYVEDERSDDAGEGSSHRALQYRDVRGRDRRNGKGGPLGAVKRIMKEDVLYLMIVNMPSESELVEARQDLARLQRH
ncbi:Burnettramic acids biosynthesis cluster protein [Sphaerulina musiva]